MGEARDRKSGLSGIGGWLAFLCVTLVVLTPIGVARDVLLTLRTPSLSPDEKWIGIAIVIAFGLFAVFAGVSLWRIRPHALLIAKTYLFLDLASSLLFASLALLDPETAAQLTVREVVQVTVYPAAWLAYLYRSERVENTYSRAPAQADETANVFR